MPTYRIDDGFKVHSIRSFQEFHLKCLVLFLTLWTLVAAILEGVGFLLVGTFCLLRRNALKVKPLLEGLWWALVLGPNLCHCSEETGRKAVGILRFLSPRSRVSGYIDIKHERKNSFLFHGDSVSFFVLLVFH